MDRETWANRCNEVILKHGLRNYSEMANLLGVKEDVIQQFDKGEKELGPFARLLILDKLGVEWARAAIQELSLDQQQEQLPADVAEAGQVEPETMPTAQETEMTFGWYAHAGSKCTRCGEKLGPFTAPNRSEVVSHSQELWGCIQCGSGVLCSGEGQASVNGAADIYMSIHR